MAKTSKVTKKRVVKIEATGMAFVKATFNNIIISLTNNEGQVISWASAGKMGFKGSKKNTLMPHKWPLKNVPRPHLTWDYAELKFMLRDLAQDVNQPSVPSIPWALK